MPRPQQETWTWTWTWTRSVKGNRGIPVRSGPACWVPGVLLVEEVQVQV